MSGALALATRDGLLTFELRGGEYALPVQRVREVLEYVPATRVPSTARSLHGVIDLRGRVVPVVDLAVRLGLADGAITRWSCIVVVDANARTETDSHATSTWAGILVDAIGRLVEPEEVAGPAEREDATGCWRLVERRSGPPLRLLDLDAALRDDTGSAPGPPFAQDAASYNRARSG